MMPKKIILIVGISTAILALIFFLLPTSHCGDEPDPEIMKLHDRADKGDMKAILILYEYEKKKGIEPFGEYLALEGALLGNAMLRKEYVKIFRNLPKEQQERMLAFIKEEEAKPGAKCLIAFLGNNQSQQAMCQK